MRVARSADQQARSAGIALLLLVTLPVLIVALLLALNTGLTVQAKLEAQRATDAAALAVCGALVDEDFLKHDRALHLRRLARARLEAQKYLELNPIQGRAMKLKLGNDLNHPEDDVLLGFLDDRRSALRPARLTQPGDDLRWINGAQVDVVLSRDRRQAIYLLGGNLTGRSSVDLTCSSTVMLARDVIGFRPVFERKPVPLMPLALLSGARTPGSWEDQVELSQQQDEWSRNRREKSFEKGRDGLPEMIAVLGPPSEERDREDHEDEHPPNVGLLHFGEDGVSGIERQIRNGVAKSDLDAGLNGEFLLGANNERAIRGMLPGDTLTSSEYDRIAESLHVLQSLHVPRIFPLYSSFRPQQRSVVVNGFVAAYVVQVWKRESAPGLVVVLQPTQTSTVTAVLASSAPAGRTVRNNRYVCKIVRVR